MGGVFEFTDAIVRRPARSVVKGLRAGGGPDPDYEAILAEHEAYVGALRAAQLRVTELPALEAFPDSVFVEDPALVFTEGAVILNSGATSRAGEAAEIAPVLRKNFDVVLPLAEGHADGGDVLAIGDIVMVGLSARTNKQGAEALLRALQSLSRKGRIVETPKDVLHFKSDCSALDEETVLATKRLAASGVFDGFRVILTEDSEEAAANALRINENLLVGAQFPHTIEKLASEGYSVIPLQTEEISKIDAGLSCMSLRWRAA
ncbi:MAG: arginine deiminase family protein [Parvularculaceae bacterium]